MLQSPGLVAIGLSAGYETWPPIGWHHAFLWLVGLNIGCDCLMSHCILGSCNLLGISTVFRMPLTVPMHSPNTRQMHGIRAVQGDCERVMVSAESTIRYIMAQILVQGLTSYEAHVGNSGPRYFFMWSLNLRHFMYIICTKRLAIIFISITEARFCISFMMITF